MKHTIPIAVALAASLLGGAERGSEYADRLSGYIADQRYNRALELMRAMPDLNVRDSDGETPLARAAAIPNNDSYDMALEALSLGADPNAPSAEGATALHRAARGGILSVVQMLVDRFAADPDSALQPDGEEPDPKQTPLAWAVRAGNIRIAEFLLDRGARFPEGTEFEMRYLMAEEARYLERYAEMASDEYVPFRSGIARARARVETMQELGAPPLVVEGMRVRERVISELAADPEWQGRSYLEMVDVAIRTALTEMSGKRGYLEQKLEWIERMGR